MFLPATREEMDSLGWRECDIILITGDAYVDSPYFGTALIGKYLLSQGYRVAVIPQPVGAEDIARFGEPRLFWGVTAGSVDSMVSNYTPIKKYRMEDDLTAGGKNTRRPDRASIVYVNYIRERFKKTRPIVLGGIEASLRRIAHYDYWSNSVRRSLLFDAKADYLVYGMGERTVLQLADLLSHGEDPRSIRGLCYAAKAKEIPCDTVILPSYEEVSADKNAFIEMFKIFSANADHITASKLVQKHADRFLVQNEPQYPLSTDELDEVYSLEFEHEAHPIHATEGNVRALDTIRFSVTAHRGCYGECSFCAIALHQGRHVVSRSEESIIHEVELFTRHPRFKGIVYDLGGPTANMYGFDCEKKISEGACLSKRCLYPSVCGSLPVDHSRQRSLFKKILSVKGVRKLFVASGVRYDLIFADKNGEAYAEDLICSHISGQMKIAPEHTNEKVLSLMGKSGTSSLIRFKKLFDLLNKKLGKKQFLSYYFIAAHPGCTTFDMRSLSDFCRRELAHRPEQVQIFTPTPSTWSTLMYYTGINPFTGEEIFVERDRAQKINQKNILKPPKHFT